jgi:hypothetical protein
MSLSNSNLYSNPYNAIKDFITNLNIDPKKGYRRNWIHASMPNINGKDFEGYPFIVLQIEVMEDNPSFDGQISDKTFRAKIIVYSDDSVQLDTICDSIAGNFKDETKLIDFKGRTLNSSAMNYTLDLKSKKILYRNIWLVFQSRL